MTARLVLHPLNVSEAERVVAGEQSDHALWAPGYDVAGAKHFLKTCAKTGGPQPFGAYEIRRRHDGYAIGGLGFLWPPDENGSVTIGYGLIPSVRGMSVAMKEKAST